MSTSGVNLSSLLSALGSSSSGINVQAAVAQAIAADSAPVNEWEQEQVTLQTQSSTISSVRSFSRSVELNSVDPRMGM